MNRLYNIYSLKKNKNKNKYSLNKKRKLLFHSANLILSLINKKKLIFNLIFLENKFNNKVIKRVLALKEEEISE